MRGGPWQREEATHSARVQASATGSRTIARTSRHYLRSWPAARPAIVEELLLRLQSHLAMEKYVLHDMVHNSDFSAIALVEEVILEHDYIVARVRQLQQFDLDDDHAREELFEDMMQTVDAHFITEARDLLPRMDRARNV
ncbi:MAG: hypothetical protein ABIU05_02810 [Nitrospirales bacterium]